MTSSTHNSLNTLIEAVLRSFREPCFAFERDGKLVAVNTAARRAFDHGDDRPATVAELVRRSDADVQVLLKNAFQGNMLTPVVIADAHAHDDAEPSLTFEAGRLSGIDLHGTPVAIARLGGPSRMIASCAEATRKAALGRADDRMRRLSEVLDLQTQVKALEQVASQDPLTRLANRGAFDAHLDRILRAAARDDTSVALVLVDVDDFKSVNDSFGHPAGDDVLVRVGEALRQCARRPLDLVARMGGDEFAVVMYDCSREDAVVRAGEARLAFRRSGRGKKSGRTTLSVGIASAVPSGMGDAASLYESADDALYRSKRAGKDRASVAAEVSRMDDPAA